MKKLILDPACGGRMFYFDKQNPHVLFCDKREFSGDLWRGKRPFEVEPDMVADFTALPFEDESFWHVVFDPPHLTQGGENSWIIKKYGKLPKDWQPYIKAGFQECWRVLKPHGTLNFKWNTAHIKVSDIIKCIEREPIYGQKITKATNNTHWLVFVKITE